MTIDTCRAEDADVKDAAPFPGEVHPGWILVFTDPSATTQVMAIWTVDGLQKWYQSTGIGSLSATKLYTKQGPTVESDYTPPSTFTGYKHTVTSISSPSFVTGLAAYFAVEHPTNGTITAVLGQDDSNTPTFQYWWEDQSFTKIGSNSGTDTARFTSISESSAQSYYNGFSGISEVKHTITAL